MRTQTGLQRASASNGDVRPDSKPLTTPKPTRRPFGTYASALTSPNQAGASPFHERVRSDPAVQNAEAPAPGYPAASAAFLVEASTLSQARAMADRILSDALATLAEVLPATEGYGFVAVAEVYPHRPPAAPTRDTSMRQPPRRAALDRRLLLRMESTRATEPLLEPSR